MFVQHQLTRELVLGVHAAGVKIMEHYRASVQVGEKVDGSPVTVADRDAEAILLEHLHSVAPDLPVISEEAASSGHIPEINDAFFLVDPLDGTREFIDRRDEFTVNVGLVEKGIPVLGIVYAPALGTLYATDGDGRAVRAKLPAVDEPTQDDLDALVAEPLSVTRISDAAPLTVVASRSHGSEALASWLARHDVKSIRNAGSSLKFCLVASGDADVYPRFGTTIEWDTAAGHAVLAAAGGVVTDCYGAPLRYGKAQDAFRNPHFIAAAERRSSFYEA